MNKAQRVTQAHVAKLAGVSQATVSHVLAAIASGGRSRVGPELHKRVQDAIELTGYVVNPIAQRLAGGRSGLIGVFTYEPLFSEGHGGFYLPFLEGIERAAEQAGWDLLLHTGAQTSSGRRRLLTSGGARSLGVSDGCILLGRNDDDRDLEALTDEGFPFVFIGARSSAIGPVPYVAPDYSTATREVLDLLFAQGHSRIAYVGDVAQTQVNSDRITTYREVVNQTGLGSPIVLDSSTRIELILDELDSTQTTAIVTDNSGIASRIRQALDARGLSVPEDMSIAQLGDAVHEDATDWSGFSIPRAELGFGALSLLTDLIDGRTEAPQRLLPCAVSEGSTMTAPRTGTLSIERRARVSPQSAKDESK